MSRMVQCKKYDQELPGLLVPPYPGKKGQEIYDSVSEKAWQEDGRIEAKSAKGARLEL